MIKIIPILLGVIGSYIAGCHLTPTVVRLSSPTSTRPPGSRLPIKMERDRLRPLRLPATLDTRPAPDRRHHHRAPVASPPWSSTSATCPPSPPPANATTSQDPGLHRTLLGDGLATTLAALFGAPANTTYGENTGVLALSKHL